MSSNNRFVDPNGGLVSRMASWAVFLCCVARCAPVYAEVLYVDGALAASCRTGSYSAESRSCGGADGAAFSTFDAAISTMQPGDTLVIRGGTYRTPLLITRSGTESAHLRFVAHAGERVIIDLDGATGTTSGIDVDGQQYIDVEGLTVYNAPLYGFRGYRNSHVTVTDCEFAFSRHGGIVFEGGSDITITRSRIHHNNQGGVWHEAVTLSEVERFSVTDSEVYENNKEGIDAKYGSRQGVVARNRVYRNNGPNIYLDAVSDIHVYGNICHDTRSNLKACIGVAIESTANPNRYQTSDITIHNNVMYGSGAGVFFWVEDTGLSWARFDNIRIEYNSIVDNASNSWGGIFFLSGTARNFGGGNTIRNNIIMGNGRRGIRDDRGVSQVFAIDHNLFQSGESSATLGSNAVVTAASPFVNRAGRDYHLSSRSPARQAAQPIPDISTDLEGRPRPPLAPDMGAYQYSAAVTPGSDDADPPTAPADDPLERIH